MNSGQEKSAGGKQISKISSNIEPTTKTEPTIKTEPITNTEPTTTAKPTRKAKTTGGTKPDSREFEGELLRGGVYPILYRYPDGRSPPIPNNFEEIKQMLEEPRSRVLPSTILEKKFDQFLQDNICASNEREIQDWLMPTIQGRSPNRRCQKVRTKFSNLDSLVDANLAPARPDCYYGALPEQLTQQVRDELHGQIVPAIGHQYPIVPNFFVEMIGPNGTSRVARQQVTYNGALGARGIHSLRSYGQDDSKYDENAYTLTSYYHNGQLTIFTSHPAQLNGSGSRPEYFITPLASYSMMNSVEEFSQGVRAFRNAIDWTRNQRDEAIRLANESLKDVPSDVDELAASPPRKRAKRS